MRFVTLTHLAALALIGERVLAWTAPKTHAKLLRRARPKHWSKGMRGQRARRTAVRRRSSWAVSSPFASIAHAGARALPREFLEFDALRDEAVRA